MNNRILLNLHGEHIRVIDGRDVPIQSRGTLPIVMGLELVTHFQSTAPLAGGDNRTVLALSHHTAMALAMQILTCLGLSAELRMVKPEVLAAERNREGEDTRPIRSIASTACRVTRA